MARAVASVTLPEASSTARPLVISTARFNSVDAHVIEQKLY